jgi:hypothetical protein
MSEQQHVSNTPPLRAGIIFGPGRTTRLPDPGTPEYQEMVNRMRNIASQQK